MNILLINLAMLIDQYQFVWHSFISRLVSQINR